MIPKNIEKNHVLKAIKEIDEQGIPKSRAARKYWLNFKGKTYPPKYVIGLANRFANGQELDPANFSGGQHDTNLFLQRLGFKILSYENLPRPKVTKRVKRSGKRTKTKKHTERCPECKKTVREFLRKIYGSVETNHKVELGTTPDAFRNTKHYKHLKRIFNVLQENRGHKDFVKAKALPRCDFYVHKSKFLLEFDESQHFTEQRRLALQAYPKSLKLGFDKSKWIEICERTMAKDNYPPFRDEQRAWYDTLRDFLPEIVGMKPTVRLYAGEKRWCDLNPEKLGDIELFKRIMMGWSSQIEHWIATVILESDSRFTNIERLKILSEAVDKVAQLTKGNGVILFPGGWFKAGKRKAQAIYNWVEEKVCNVLKDYSANLAACVGIDGSITDDGWLVDQVAAAVTQKGIIAMGRKFHATKEEKKYIKSAKDYLEKEDGFPRIFELGSKKYFLCACYDGFGIKHKRIPKLGIDVVLDLVHGFHPKGEGGSGDVYFAKNGFAGSSKEWGCPVFGAAVFFDRSIPDRWPSGVLWNKGNMHTRYWKYEDNPLQPLQTFDFLIKEGRALIRIFRL